mgnify:CR=1 FL=1
MNQNTKKFIFLHDKIKELNSHKLFEQGATFTKEELKVFMEFHIYAVWDFMSIVKSLQDFICPSTYPWRPNKYTRNGIAHLINEIVFSEESDVDEDDNYFSHFDLYVSAMNDVGADSSKAINFIENFELHEYNLSEVPKESFKFIQNTFNCIKSNKLSNIAAIFTYGRETTIPDMFSKILSKIDKKDIRYNNLRLYIRRHIEVDSSRHGPLSIQLFNYTCENNQDIFDEAVEYAIKAIEARILLWDGVLKKIKNIN